MTTAPMMASAIITNWNRLRMAVRRDSCCSMDSTSASMAVTNSSAAITDSVALIGAGASHCPRRCAQIRSTSANLTSTSSSQGTNSGREGSPVRSSLRLSSNWLTSDPSEAGDRLVCTALASRQVCMRMRPASFTAAAPPSSCQVTHSVRLMDASATTSRLAPMRISLVESDAVRNMARG